MQRKIINKIFEALSLDNPNPSTELKYKDNFTMMIAVVLSAQATDVSVNKATSKLFIEFDTPYKLVNLGEEKLKSYIRNIGLYNSKAKNIIGLCKKLISDYQGKVPNNFEDLISLPGVGRKTANVVLNCAYGIPVIAVDTHVFRVSRRVGISMATTIGGVEKDLLKKIPQKWLRFAHYWLVLHGRYICKAKKPDCKNCKIRYYCQYYKINNLSYVIS